MIYTVTFNPALDYVLRVGQLAPGRLHRAESASFAPGGKGINVSAVLQNFGVPSVATGFVAGDVGEIICRKLKARGIETDFIRIPGQSRVNVKIKGKEETEINASGPDIPREALEALAKKLSGVPAGSVLVLAGSVPASLPKDIYERLLAALARPDLRVVADASGELLLDVLPFRPWLIKPNRDELDETFGRHMRSVDEALSYAEKLRTMGAPRHFILACVWTSIELAIVLACLGALILGTALSVAAGFVIASQTGISMMPSLGLDEFAMLAVVIVSGAVFALLPAAAVGRSRLV